MTMLSTSECTPHYIKLAVDACLRTARIGNDRCKQDNALKAMQSLCQVTFYMIRVSTNMGTYSS